MPASMDVEASTALYNNKQMNGITHNEEASYSDMQRRASSSAVKLPDSSSSSGVQPALAPGSLHIRQTTSAGRGVFAAVPMPAGTLVEVSHVLLFPAKEYADHGRHTQLDDYTYVWTKGSEGRTMALALGLGSLFNHSHSSPNTSYVLDRPAGTIQYTLIRSVHPGEELLISYGTGKMWWEDRGDNGAEQVSSAEGDDEDSDERLEDELLMLGSMGVDLDDREARQLKRRDERRRLAHLHPNTSSRLALTPTPPTSSPLSIVPPKSVGPEAAPLWRITAAVDPTTTPLELMTVWAVDIDPRKSSHFLQFSRSIARRLRAAEEGGDGQEHMGRKQDDGTCVDDDDIDGPESNDETEDEDEALKHLRLFHRLGEGESLSALVCRVQDVPSTEKVVGLLSQADVVVDGTLPRPFQVQVPKFAAPSRQRLPEWKAYWPVVVKPGKINDILAKSSLSGAPTTNQGSPTPGVVDRAADARLWNEETIEWALNNFRKCIALAKQAKERGELPVGVHVTPVYSDAEVSTSLGPDGHPWIEVDAWDTRKSERNPIKHGVTNAIRDVAKLRSDRDRERLIALGAKVAALNRDPHGDPHLANRMAAKVGELSIGSATLRNPNGQDYLLNNLTLFTTHEPCVSCCMALVHSRVRSIFFIEPSPGAGGCCGSGLEEDLRCSFAEDGGPYAVQEQAGLNHHFDVWKWVGDPHQLVDENLHDLLDIHGLDA